MGFEKGSKECRGLLLWLPVAFSILGSFEGPCVKYENDSCPCDAHLYLETLHAKPIEDRALYSKCMILAQGDGVVRRVERGFPIRVIRAVGTWHSTGFAC